MPETEILTPAVDADKNVAPVVAPVATKGNIRRSEINLTQQQPPLVKEENQSSSTGSSDIEVPPVVEKNAEEEIPELTEAQKRLFFKKLGIDYTGDDDLKNKLKPATSEPTEEERKKAAIERELKLLNLYVKNGGTPEDYNTIGQIAKADPKEFSYNQVISELKDAGFTKAQAENILKERYYQIELDKIEQNFPTETDDEFEERKKELKKKIDYGAKKLASHSLYQQNQAASVLKSLGDAVDAEELQAKLEITHAANVDAHLKTLARKKTYELGKVNDQPILPIEHEISEQSIAKVAELLKDPAKRNNFFYNQDNTLNLSNLSEILLQSYEFQRAIKGALLEGQNRQVKEFEKVFPGRTPYEIGVGGSQAKNNAKGTAVSTGKVQRVSPTNNH